MPPQIKALHYFSLYLKTFLLNRSKILRFEKNAKDKYNTKIVVNKYVDNI